MSANGLDEQYRWLLSFLINHAFTTAYFLRFFHVFFISNAVVIAWRHVFYFSRVDMTALQVTLMYCHQRRYSPLR